MHELMQRRLQEENPVPPPEEEPDEEEVVDKSEDEWRGLQVKPLCAVSERLTRAQFMEWKNAFDAELIRTGALVRMEKTRLNGRQFFTDAGKAGDDAEAAAEAEAEAQEAVDTAFDESLFAGDDLDD